jgi:hypothetical protein
LAIAMRITSVSTAMPEASSSAPGAVQFGLLPQPETIESWCPPRITISPGSAEPGMVRTTDGCGVMPPCEKNSTVTSGRPAARLVHWFLIQVADWCTAWWAW